MSKYSSFDFKTSARMASNQGNLRGIVNNETGEITAIHSFGLMGYREEYNINISDDVNVFPYTLKDRIIMAAKKAKA